MKVLSVNAGSSSLKFTLFQMPEKRPLISGNFERIGLDYSFYTLRIDANKQKVDMNLPSHKEAFHMKYFFRVQGRVWVLRAEHFRPERPRRTG